MRHDHPAFQVRFPWRLIGISGLLVSATVGLGTVVPAAGPPLEVGIWYNDSGRGAVEIRPCGASGRDAHRLCGYIVWLKNPNFKNGKPLFDGYNPDPTKRKRPICGLPVLGALQRVSAGYDNGWVYDPEQGKAFDAAIQLQSRDRLILTGYKGIKFFSKSFVWKRAPADLPRCDVQREARATIDPVKATVPVKPADQPQAQAPQPKAQAPMTQESEAIITPPRPVPAVRPAPAQIR